MYQSEIKIPRDRVAVLIGIKGATKQHIQKLTKAKLQVSKEGEILMTTEDTVTAYLATPVIKAIGRGVNPEVALELLKEDICLEVISIPEFTGKSPEKLKRIKARLIGTKGKARHLMEKLTHTHIVVYGKTVALIGNIEDVAIAKQAVEKLLNGAPHSNVYNFIKAQRKQLKAFQ